MNGEQLCLVVGVVFVYAVSGLPVMLHWKDFSSEKKLLIGFLFPIHAVMHTSFVKMPEGEEAFCYGLLIFWAFIIISWISSCSK